MRNADISDQCRIKIEHAYKSAYLLSPREWNISMEVLIGDVTSPLGGLSSYASRELHILAMHKTQWNQLNYVLA